MGINRREKEKTETRRERKAINPETAGVLHMLFFCLGFTQKTCRLISDHGRGNWCKKTHGQA